MKSEFDKFATGLSKEEIDHYNHLFRNVWTHLRRSHADIFSFLYSRQPTILMTHNILLQMRDIAPRQRREIQKPIHGILENIRSQFSKEVSRKRRSQNSAYVIPLHRLDKKYVEGLVDRINNRAMKDAAADILIILASVKDREIKPEITESLRPSWRSEHYAPVLGPFQEKYFTAQYKKVAQEMYVDPDEVFDFIYDTIYEDGSTMTTDMFDEVVESFGVEDVLHTNQLYMIFEERMNKVKEHFRDFAARECREGRMSLSHDDPYWFDMAEQINNAMDEVAYDLTEIIAQSDGMPIIQPAPSFQR
jgi:hypothetical protein